MTSSAYAQGYALGRGFGLAMDTDWKAEAEYAEKQGDKAAGMGMHDVALKWYQKARECKDLARAARGADANDSFTKQKS